MHYIVQCNKNEVRFTMADTQSKIDAAAEKAFAEAAEKKTATEVVAAKPALVAPVAAPTVKAEAAKPAAPKAAAKKAAPKKAVKKVAVRKAVAKPAPKKTVVRKALAQKPARVAIKSIKPINTITQLKDKIMATTKTTDFTKTAQDAAADLQARAKAAYEKGTEMTADVTAFHKGNFDAVVESSKILAAGVQDLGRNAVEDAKTAAETVTADIKAMAAVKSPTELFQLQGEIARRNLDTLVARTSKNAEVMMKLANDMFAPISTRASVAMERLTKAA
jgi:phasin family protein